MITVNGITYHGNNVSIVNGKVIIDGKQADTKDDKVITITVTGNIESLEADYCKSIVVNGDVNKLRTTSGDVECGNVTGGVQTTSGDIECGNIGGDVNTTSGDIKCDDVHGSVKTLSGDIKHRKTN